MAFKIKDGVRIGTVDVFNNSAESLNVKVKDTNSGAGYIALNTASLGSTNYTQTFKAATGTIALTSDIPTVNDATLTLTVAEDGTTGNSVYITTGTGFSANDSTDVTYDIHVGPSLKNLADTMTGATTGFLKKSGADTYSLDTNSYSLTSHTHYIGTTGVQSSSANQALTGILSVTMPGSTSGSIQLIPTAAAGTGTVITMPATTGTMALTSDIKDGTLAVSVSGTAAASGTALAWGTSSGFSANTESNSTYDLRVGPAISALATVMSGASTGILKKTAADTYTLDTTAYLTAESDTLQTVTGRGASSNVATITLSGGTASTNTTTGTLVVTGGVGVSGALNVGGDSAVGGNLTITGDLTVNGTTTTINVDTVTVEDKNIVLGNVTTPTDTTADGGGITLKGATDKTLNWVNATDAWTSSEHIALSAGKNLQLAGATSGLATIVTAAAAGNPTLTLPTTTGILALTSQIPTVNDGTLTLNIGSAGATNTTVTVGTGTGFSANTSTNATYQLSIGPAITNLASTMTGAGTGFLKKNGADTYVLDTNTYLSSQSNDFGTVTVSDTDSGHTWAETGSAAADTTGDTLTLVSGTGINIDVSATTDAIRIAHADTSTLSGAQGTAGIASITVDDNGHVTGVTTATYLTAESDTLQSVTGRGNTSTNNIQLNSGASLALSANTAAKIWTNAVVPSNITVNTETVIDSWAAETYRSAKYTVQLVQGSKYQQHEVRMIHDGSSVYMTEYAVLETNAASPIPVTFTASIATGTLSFKATVTDAATTNVAVIIERTLFAV